MTVHVTSRPRPDTTCALCRDVVDAPVTCPRCAVGYHRACLSELGSTCATLGCDAALGPEPAPPAWLAPPAPSTSASSAFGGSATHMSPRARIGVGVALSLLGAVSVILQIVVTARGDWAEPAPTWWQLALSITLFGIAQFALGVGCLVSGVRELREP